MNTSFENQVVLVTGATAGIGYATALAFAKQGARLIVSGRSVVAGKKLEDELLTLGAEAVFVQADISDEAEVTNLINTCVARFGRIDLLINNAVYQNREINDLIPDISTASLERSMLGNVIAPFHLAQRLLPTMVAQGGGRIINVCSAAGQFNPPVPADKGGWGFAYGASKAAIARLAGCINTEYKTQGVRAFSVNPGVVTTEAVKATLGDDGVLAQRYGAATPEEIAAALFWLGTEEEALPLAKAFTMIDLQPIYKERVAAVAA